MEETPKKRRGIIHIIPNRCKGCGFCIEFCPLKILSVSKEFNNKGYHPPAISTEKSEKCSACLTCELICPEFAVHVEKLGKDEKGKNKTEAEA